MSTVAVDLPEGDESVRVDTILGQVAVVLDGDFDGPVFLTVPEFGLTYQTCWQTFSLFARSSTKTALCRCSFAHLSWPYDTQNEVTPDTLIEVLHQVVQHLHSRYPSFPSQLFLMGVGTAGRTLLSFAARYQQMVRGVVLLNTGCGAQGWLEWAHVWLQSPVDAHLERLFCQLTKRNLLDYHRQEFLRLSSEHPKLADYLALIDRRQQVAADTARKLPDVPYLLVTGDLSSEEQDCAELRARLLAAGIGDVESVSLADVGALACEEAPRRLLEPLELWLHGIGVRPRNSH
ncbi:MAG: hypothetical protein MHM6MM_005928 [Cercozoa sp. M6MM]